MKETGSIKIVEKIRFFRCILFAFLCSAVFASSSLAAGWVDLNSGVTVSPAPVTVGKNFTVSFALKEYRGESKTFEYVQLWIQDGSGNDLYDAAIWNNVSFSSLQQKNFSATTFLDPAYGRKPGSYRAIVRGKIAGDVPFNFGIISGSGAVNPRNFSAVPIIAQGPMSGPPGTTFTQWGEGFTANSTATLHFKKPDGTEYPTQPQAMDSTGHFETPYPSPKDKAPGQYTWWAVDGPTGISSNQVTYTIEKPPVNPAVAQSPISGVPGTIFTQWGTGFTPNSTATLHFKKPDGTEYPTQQQAMDSTGHFETKYTAPLDKAPGQYTWWAVDGPTGVSSNQVTYTIEKPPVNPAVAQSPMSGVPGTTFTQWGTGFTPNSTATLHFKKPDGTEYPTQQQAMDSTGHFETKYTAPLDKAPGQYTWWAVDGPTGISSNQVTYTIEKPPVNPAVAQSPMSGVPGTVFTQWGEGFTANSTATLHFKKPDGTEYPTQPQAMDSTGHFETKYTAPLDKASGQYTWWAVDGPTGVSSNQVTYTIEKPPVNPAVAQSPMSGVPGTVFTQWGTGFTPNSTATLHFKKPDGTEYPTQQQAMDSTGHFETKYTAPLDKAPGQYTWWAVDGPTGVSSNQVTYTIEKPPVNPAVAQSPMSGVPGTTFTQWGTGFTPNSTATLHFKKPDGTEYEPAQQPIDSTGHFETPYPSPKDKAPGQYTWWAVDGPTGVSSNQVTYTIEKPPVNPTVAQSPMSGVPGTTFTQSGTGFTPNSTATLHFKKPDGTEYEPKPQVIDSIGNFEIPYPSPKDKAPGQYTWWAVDGPTGVSSNQITYAIDTLTYKAWIDISSIPKDIVQSGISELAFNVVIKNIGTANLVGIPVKIEHETNFAVGFWNCYEEEKSENAVCSKNSFSVKGAIFSATIPVGGFITIRGRGDVASLPIVLTVTAHNTTKTVLRGPKIPADLTGTQEAMLCSEKGCCKNNECTPDILGIDKSKDTIVLTHGLQKSTDCNHENLWTGFKFAPAQAGYLLNEKYNGSVNVLQFFWKGACQEHGWFGVPTKTAYENARKNVYYAGEQLAYLLLHALSEKDSGEISYSGKIHFIGHSLGTAVTAYASNIFLRQAPNVKNAQVTILDYPNKDRIGKIAGFIFSSKEEKEFGFDKNFFASTLPLNLSRDGYHLLVDNYFAAEIELDTKIATAGVGTEINGPFFYNHHQIKNSEQIGILFLPNEGKVQNDHSGIHQWYRWSIKQNREINFYGENICSSQSWNELPLVAFDTATEQPIEILEKCCFMCDCKKLGELNPSVSPCDGGWHYSIIDGGTFPTPNGNEADKTSSFQIEPSNVTTYGCAAGGMVGSYICRETGTSAASSAMKTAAVAASVSEPPQSPERFYAEFDVNVPEFVRYISFDYTFTNVGDGDYVHLFAEGKSIWLMSGNIGQQGQKISSGPIPLRMTSGPNKLVVSLYGVGEKNAEFKIENLKFTAVKDTDGDKYADDDDEFPADRNEWLDTDEDGIGNNGDTDDDNDGFLDTDDAFSLNPKENADTDGDGIGDYADLDDNMYPDLAVISRSLNKTGLAPGEDFICWAAVKNKGTARTTSAPVRYYLSTDSTISTSDTLLGSSTAPVLNSGSTSWVRADLNAPNESGTYWLGSCVDAVSGDSNEANNCSFGFKITVATNLPDLTLSNLSAPYQVKTGERFSITFEVTNQGTLDSVQTTAEVRYVDTATLANLAPIRQESIPALAVNQTISRSPSIKAPCKAGDYLLSACVNPGENIERGENNNCELKYLVVRQGDEVCIEGEEKSSIFPAIDLLLK
uniref:CARDB domain-containing protein n=1 Tax=Candidatus Electronema sp. TaxID=2698783 RepID=UPI004056383A